MAQDRLQGAASVQPVQLPVTSPVGRGTYFNSDVKAGRNQHDSAVLGQLSGLAGGLLDRIIEKRNTQSMVEGQMAAMQGKSLEQANFGGDKHAIEGYRAVEAQTAMSTMLNTAMAAIDQGEYELDPDQYRAKVAERAAGLVDGIADPHVRQMVQSKLVEQLPKLTADHLSKNLAYKEEKNYDSLVQSIDVVSRDPSSVESLLSFAKGDAGSPTSGLPEARRTEAVVDGVTLAFQKDNFLAYSYLKKSGALDNLSASQLQKIESARGAYENRKLAYYNEEYATGERAILDKIEQGDYEPQDAVSDLAALNEAHGVRTKATQAGAIYEGAEDTQRTKAMTKQLVVDEAYLRKDYNAMAAATAGDIMFIESGGRDVEGPLITSGANAGDKAQGRMQVMPKTLKDPGYGVRPAQNDTAEEYARVGRDYWRAMVNRYNGDLEAAAVAYNGGAGTADKWLASGRDFSVLPDPKQSEGYVNKLRKRLGKDYIPTAAQQYEQATKTMKATRERMALESWEGAQPELMFNNDMYERGQLTYDQWKQDNDRIYDQYGVQRDAAVIKAESAVVQNVAQSIIDDRKAEDASVITAGQNLASDVLSGAGAILDSSFKAEMTSLGDRMAAFADRAKKGKWNDEERLLLANGYTASNLMRDQSNQFNAELAAVSEKHGKPLLPDEQLKKQREITAKMTEAMDGYRKFVNDGNLIKEAEATGTVGELSNELQERALKQMREGLVADVQKSGASPEEAASIVENETAAYYAKSGFMDDRMQRIIKGTLSKGDWASTVKDPATGQNVVTGNPDVAAAINTMAKIKADNPQLYESVLNDKTMRTRVDAAILRSGGLSSSEFNSQILQQVIGDIPADMEVRKEYVEGRMPEFQDKVKYLAQNEARNSLVTLAPKILERTGDGWFDIGMSGSTSVLGNLLTSRGRSADGSFWDYDSQQLEARLDPEGKAQNTFREAVLSEIESRMMVSNTRMSSDEVVKIASESVKSRGAFIGGDFVIMPEGSSVKEILFGKGTVVDTVGAENRVVLDLLRKPEIAAQFGDRISGDARWFGTGLNSFEVMPYSVGGQMSLRAEIETDDGEWIPIVFTPEQLREAGNDYMKAMRQR